MKKYLSTGLAILLPAVLTFLIIAFLVNLVTNPFHGIVENFLQRFDHQHENLVKILRVFSRIIILIGLFLFVTLVGFLAQLYLMDYLFPFIDRLLKRLPLIGGIYLSLQEVVTTLFGSDSRTFSQVVMVPFPDVDNLSIGLVVKKSIEVTMNGEVKEIAVVFVPCALNITVGVTFLYETKDLQYLDMKPEEAFKFVVSCGASNVSIS